jgi:hypothetical protein
VESGQRKARKMEVRYQRVDGKHGSNCYDS